MINLTEQTEQIVLDILDKSNTVEFKDLVARVVNQGEALEVVHTAIWRLLDQRRIRVTSHRHIELVKE